MPQPTPAALPQLSRSVYWIGNILVLLATGAFWLFMTTVCFGHTPDAPDAVKWALAAYTAACISGVFWIALQGFRVTLSEHLRVKKFGPVS
jgi:hypothetical protein